MIIAESGTAWAHEDPAWRKSRLLAYALHARISGADYIKVQMFAPGEPLFCPLPGDENRWVCWHNSILTFDDWVQVKQTCESNGIKFMASAFQHTTVEWLNQLGVDYHKVASRAAGSYPFDKVTAPLIVSDGMGLWRGGKYGCRYLLHCNSKYPTPLNEARWPGCDRSDYAETHGLSDHSGTPWPAIDALARGAEIVEVHFKLDDDGPDAASSVTVDELKMICDFQKALKEMG